MMFDFGKSCVVNATESKYLCSINLLGLDSLRMVCVAAVILMWLADGIVLCRVGNPIEKTYFWYKKCCLCVSCF